MQASDSLRFGLKNQGLQAIPSLTQIVEFFNVYVYS
jgi:hypothetical protein